MIHLVSQYPTTREYREKLEALLEEPILPMVVSTITASGYREVFRHFRRLKTDAIYVPVIDPSGLPLLAPLQVLSMFARTDRRMIVNPDLSTYPFGRSDALVACFQMALGTLNGLFRVVEIRLRARNLLMSSRIKIRSVLADRIVYLKTNLWLGVQAGGSIAHTSGVIGGFLGENHSVDFVSVEAPVALPADDGLSVTPVAPTRSYVIPRELNHYWHNDRFVDTASPLFRTPRGFIYQRLSLGNFAGVVLSRRHRVPLVIEYNGSESWLAKNWGTPLIMEKTATMTEEVCLKHAHLVVTVSDVLRDELIARGTPPERIVSSPNGVNTEIYDSDRYSRKQRLSLRRRYGIPDDAVVVTFVGTFGPWHGAEIFARTIQRMTTQSPAWIKAQNIWFLFIGDGVRRSVVENLLADTVVRSHVTITGLIEQMETPVHLAASDILVSPHVRNPDQTPFFGSPTKLFEYLASGRPVIGSNLDQIGEVLAGCPHARDLDWSQEKPEQGTCGVLVEPENTDDMESAIKFLVENSDWRQEAGRNARARALDRYTWRHHVQSILETLQNVVATDARTETPTVRLLFNGLHSLSGGGLTYLRNIVPLMSRDPEVEVHLCLHEDQQKDLPAGLEGVAIHCLKFKRTFWQLQVREQIEVPRLARRIGADVTFSPANYGPVAAPNSIILLRNALSVAFVERRPLKLGYWALLYLGTLLSLLVAQRAITVSEYARRAAGGGFMNLLGDRLTVIPHGVSNIFSSHGNNVKRERFLLAVSDIYVQKNLKNLIRALALLEPDHPDIALKIAGHPVDVEYFEDLKRTVAREGLGNNVEFLGGVSPKKLVDLYRRCAVFVFPSTVETFGNPLVEAMACGAPIACSSAAAMPEVVDDAAVFFDPHNTGDMASVIGSLLNDDEQRRSLGEKAEERSKLFTWERTSEKTLAVIKEVANSRPQGTP